MKVTKATKNDLVILNDIYNSELRRIILGNYSSFEK